MLKKKVEVIMLPTNQKSKICLSFKEKSFNQLIEPKLTLIEKSNYQLSNIQSQHLYFVDDSPIKSGDWFIMNGCILRECNHVKVQYGIELIVDTIAGEHHVSVCKKVIATTDKSLEPNKNWTNLENPSDIYLPQPSDSFIAKYIEMYNAGNPIKYVMVDYEYSCGCQGRVHDGCEYEEAKLKTDKSNTITITRCKENYSAEEVNKILDSFAERFVANTDTAYKKKDIFDWKIQNL